MTLKGNLVRFPHNWGGRLRRGDYGYEGRIGVYGYDG